MKHSSGPKVIAHLSGEMTMTTSTYRFRDDIRQKRRKRVTLLWITSSGSTPKENSYVPSDMPQDQINFHIRSSLDALDLCLAFAPEPCLGSVLLTDPFLPLSLIHTHHPTGERTRVEIRTPQTWSGYTVPPQAYVVGRGNRRTTFCDGKQEEGIQLC